MSVNSDDSDCSQRQLDQQMRAIMYPPPVAGGGDAAVAAAEEEYDAVERMAVDTPPVCQQRTVIQPSTTATGRDTPASLESSDDDDDDGNSADGSPYGGAAAGATSASTAAAAAAVTAAATTTSTTTTGKKRRGRPSLGGTTTTARSAKSAKKKKAMQDKSRRCQKGARVKVTRGNLYHVLVDDDQKKAIEKEGQSVNLHGTILSGTKATGYNIRFDDLPDGKKDVIVRRRAIIVVLQPGEEEKAHDHEQQAEEEDEVREDRRTASEKFSSIEFSKLDPVVQAGAKEFVMNFSEITQIQWEILADNEHVTECPLEIPETVEYKKDIYFDDETTNYNDIFFEYFFPDMTGHGKIMDEYHADPKSPYFATVRSDKIQFHDEDAEDPDWKVKRAYTLLIAAASEVESGVENLWKQGKSNGRRDYPDFGQFMPLNYFKAFQAAAAYCWSDKKYWHMERRNIPWEVFFPCLQSFNERRRNLIMAVLLMLDEAMAGWRPKTSKLGGLPNYTFEPRKPVPLGTMFRNGVECISGALMFQDVVQNPEMQAIKKFQDEPSSLPGNKPITAHTAEVLRQVEGAGIPTGGWVGGDSWFGSVASAVEVYKRFGVHSTFIIKTNVQFYPMQVLCAILRARHGDRPAGHWVVLKTKIADVPLIAIAYAWSQRGISYFLSTCGTTTPHDIKYQSHFEDDYGNVQWKEINRPSIAHFLYEYLPLIDEHNRQRQSLLGLERCWPTKDCWFRLVTTLLGMSVVDMHRWHRNCIHTQHAEKNHARGEQNLSLLPAISDEVAIRKFSDMICVNLEPWKKNQRASPRVRQNEMPRDLERLMKDGSTTRPPTAKQIKSGKRVGTAVNGNCFVCRKYIMTSGTTNYVQTNFCCVRCKMPLCKLSRADAARGRHNTCLEEHLNSQEQHLGCFEVHVASTPFPSDKREIILQAATVTPRMARNSNSVNI